MAEAILFGHRALQPLIDLQEELQKAVGKPKRIAVPRARHRLGPRLRRRRRRRAASSSSSTSRRPAPTRRWPTSSRSPPSRSRAARSPTAGRRSSTRAGRSSATRCTASPTRTSRRRPSPGRGGRSRSLDVRRRRARRRPQRRLRPRLPRGGRSATAPASSRAATSTRWSIAREGYPDLENYKLPTLSALLRHRARPEPPGAAGRRGDRQPAALVRATTCRVASRRCASGDRRLGPGQPDRRRHQGKLLEAARREARVSKSLFSLVHKKTVRRLALDEGIRMDGRGLTDIRPISVEVGPPAARPRLRPVHPRRDAGADDRHARLVIGRPAHRHDQPRDREALHPPLQLPALQHRREQADARPQPARHRPRQPGRAGAHPGPAEPRGVPVRHPARVASA